MIAPSSKYNDRPLHEIQRLLLSSKYISAWLELSQLSTIQLDPWIYLLCLDCSLHNVRSISEQNRQWWWFCNSASDNDISCQQHLELELEEFSSIFEMIGEEYFSSFFCDSV